MIDYYKEKDEVDYFIHDKVKEFKEKQGIKKIITNNAKAIELQKHKENNKYIIQNIHQEENKENFNFANFKNSLYFMAKVIIRIGTNHPLL